MHKYFSRLLFAKLLMVGAFLLLSGCDQLPVVSPTVTPTAVPTETLEPTSTLTPTPTPPTMPEGPYPPLVLAYEPRPGQEVQSDAIIRVRFDQPMDQQSVSTALKVSPEVEGDLEWQNQSTVVFRPKALASATKYYVSLGADARSEDGLPLSNELFFAFSTLSPLEVTRASPGDGSVDVRADAPLLVAFNRPIVPLNCTGMVAEGNCRPLPLNFSPAVLGDGSWINTSLYRFDPLSGWAAGVLYEVTLDDSVVSVDGAGLVESYAWSFTTATPVIQEIKPANGQKNVPLDAGVQVIFNTPMDQEITGSVFSVRSENGDIVLGTVTWEDNGAVLVFTPTQLLNLATRYTVRVSERARAVTSAPLENPQSWSFETVPYPSVVNIGPADGDRDVRVNEPVRITFAGLVDTTKVMDHVLIEPEPDTQSLYTYFDADAAVYHISWEKAPRTEYCVTVQPELTDVYGHAFAEGASACFTTGDLDPFVGPATMLRSITLDAQEPASLYFLVRNQARAPFVLSELDEAAFLGERSGALGTELRSWTESFDVALNEVTVEEVSLTRRGGPLDPGYYKLTWTTPEWGDRTLNVAVLDRHVTLKLASEEALVWVTDLRSGVPVTRTAVRLLDQQGVLIAAGTTDLDGVARIPISPRENLWDSVAAVVGEPGASGFGVAKTDWEADVTPWAFDITLDAGPFIPFTIYLHTDRPIYRPGQSVLFRGILRENQDMRYRSPEGDVPVVMTLRDPMWDVVYSTTLALSDIGTFDGVVPLSEDALVGDYTLEATLPGLGDHYPWVLNFSVAAYRKPEFEVRVTPEFSSVLAGETVRAVIDAAYFFGGPVSDASLQWIVRAVPYHFVPEPSSVDVWHGPSDPGLKWQEPEIIAQGEAMTDENGRFLIELPANLEPLGDDDDTLRSQRWTIEATLSDESGFPVSGREDVVVHAAEFYLGLQLDPWVVQADERSRVEVLALDWQSLPVASVDIALSLVQRDWYHAPAARPFESPTWTYTDTVVSTVEVTSDEEGKASATFTPPQSGAYVVVAEALDSERHPVYTEAPLWVSGEESARWQMAEGRITPVADRDLYQVGDTARILLPTPFDGPYHVLMTVEREGVLDVVHATFEVPNPVVEVPIRDLYVPNVYISFVVVRGVDDMHPVPDVRAGYVNLSVEPQTKLLNVELVPDSTSPYEPGAPVALTVRTTDAAGQAVDAEVGLSVVDKAVLALRETNVPSLVRAFYGKHPLRVVMGDSLLVLFNRLAQELATLNENAERLAAEMTVGGIGGGGGGMEAALDIHEDFPDTALWEAHLRTGPSGEAQVTFDLPDSLTTWVVDARAVTADTKVGEACLEILVTQPLLVRPVTPRFFVVGDQVEVAAVVHNNTPDDLSVVARLLTEGSPLGTLPEQTIEVLAGGRARVSWSLTIPETAAETLPLVFSVEGGGYQHASRPTFGETQSGIPVYRFETPDVLVTSGVLEEAEARLEAVFVPATAGDASALTVQVQPSLAAGLLDSLKYLERYPYETTDVLVSRFLPNILTYRALQTLDVDAEDLESDLQSYVVDALDRLYTRQNVDGGWGWWRDWSNMHLTSYVVLGLVEARNAGYTIQEPALERALAYIYETLRLGLQTGSRYPHYAFTLYALSEADYDWPTGAASALYAGRDGLGITGRAYLAQALGLADASDTRLAALLEDMRAEANITASGAHWDTSEPQVWSTSTQATSVVLDTLVRFAPEDPLIAQAARWLMVARRGDHWETTYETAWAVMALTNYMKSTGELVADYNWGVALNGVPVLEGLANDETLKDSWQVRAAMFSQSGIPALVRETPNALEFSKQAGPGRLYYLAALELSRPVGEVTSEQRGIAIQRAYCALTTQSEDVLSPCEPVTAVRPGDLLEVRLTLVLPQSRYFVLVEDPYPAGFEPVDLHLRTQPQIQVEALPSGDESPPPSLRVWRDPFDRRELRDERAVFFANNLAPGTYQVSYVLRAALPGRYHALPATASEVYFPDVWGRTVGQVLQVLPVTP